MENKESGADNSGFERKPSFNREERGGDRKTSFFKREDRPRTTESNESGERRSFNPNFTDKNRVAGGGERRSYGNDRPSFNREGGDRPRPSFNREGGDRPRPSFNREGGDRPSFDRNRSDRPSFNRDREGGERRSFGGDRPSFNREGGDRPRPAFNREGGDRPSFGDRPRPSFNREGGDRPRPSFNREGGDRPSFDRNRSDRPSFGRDGGERRPYNNDRPSFNREGGDRPSFGDRPRPSFNREGGDRPRPSFNREGGDRPSFDRNRSDRPSFNRDREGGERRSFGGDRPSFNREGGDRPRPAFNREGGDRPSFGDRPRPSFNREGGDRPSFGDRPRPSFNREGGDRPRPSFNREGGERRSFGGDRPSFDREARPERPSFNRDGDRGGFKREDRDGGERRFERRDETPKQNPYVSEELNVASELLKGDIRLNRYVSMSGICSRRDADALIESGRIAVNGEVVTALGSKVSANDVVSFDGEVIRGEKNVYILMNKPKDYVTTLEDPNAEKIVTQLLNGQVSERVYPVGRLDKNSLGVLILTNDGEFTKILTHPSFNKKKIYHVLLDKPLREEDMEKLATGVELEDGLIFADEISCDQVDKKEVGIEIHSGRNRVVRRMFESVGYKVRRLDRVYFAGLTKKGLQRGEWRYLTQHEVEGIKKDAKTTTAPKVVVESNEA